MCVCVYVCIYVCGEQDILYVYILCVCMCFPLTPFKMQEFIVLPCYWFFFEMIVSYDVRVSQTLSTCSSLTELNLSDNQVRHRECHLLYRSVRSALLFTPFNYFLL